MELDNLAAETAATMTTDHPDYAILAARLAISNLHKETKKHFSGKINLFFHVFIFVLSILLVFIMLTIISTEKMIVFCRSYD